MFIKSDVCGKSKISDGLHMRRLTQNVKYEYKTSTLLEQFDLENNKSYYGAFVLLPDPAHLFTIKKTFFRVDLQRISEIYLCTNDTLWSNCLLKVRLSR